MLWQCACQSIIPAMMQSLLIVFFCSWKDILSLLTWGNQRARKFTSLASSIESTQIRSGSMPCRGESACCAHESKLRTDRSFLTRLRRVFSLPSGFAPTPISHLLPGTACSTTRVCGYDVLLIGRCLEWSVHASLERLWRQQNALLPSSTATSQAACVRCDSPSSYAAANASNQLLLHLRQGALPPAYPSPAKL